MPIGAKAYRQQATYWGSPSTDGWGQATFAPPVLISCRWEDRIEVFTDMAGEERRSSSIVWTYNILEVGGYLVKGNQLAMQNPTDIDGSLRIQRADEIPDLRGLNYERRHYL